jgi:hypothetical protein
MDEYPAPHRNRPRTSVVVANPKSPRVLGWAFFLDRNTGWGCPRCSLTFCSTSSAQDSIWTCCGMVMGVIRRSLLLRLGLMKEETNFVDGEALYILWRYR